MTRKRFIRLVMAEGIQRNQAHDIAFRMWVIHENWEESYRHFRLVKHHLPDLTVRMDDVLEFAVGIIRKAVEHASIAFRDAALKIRPITIWSQEVMNHEENTGH